MASGVTALQRPRAAISTRRSPKRFVPTIAFSLVLIVGSIVFVMPFIWMLSTSLKKSGAVFQFPPQWIPKPVVWSNYATAVDVMDFPILLKNTVLVTSLSMVGAIATSSLAAYSFARLRFPGRDLIFIIVLATMMLPEWVTLIPVYIIFRNLRMINTLWPLIIPSFFGGGAFNIFLLRQFYMTLPFELDDAAKIDGCSNFRIYWNILLPLCKPALGAIAVFQFVGHWNDFFGPLIYLHSAEKMTLAVGLYRFKGPFSVEWNYLMAATVMVAIAPIVVYFLAQRYFIEGVVMTGMKG